jgi:hypothetical protein
VAAAPGEWIAAGRIEARDGQMEAEARDMRLSGSWRQKAVAVGPVVPVSRIAEPRKKFKANRTAGRQFLGSTEVAPKVSDTTQRTAIEFPFAYRRVTH